MHSNLFVLYIINSMCRSTWGAPYYDYWLSLIVLCHTWVFVVRQLPGSVKINVLAPNLTCSDITLLSKALTRAGLLSSDCQLSPLRTHISNSEYVKRLERDATTRFSVVKHNLYYFDAYTDSEPPSCHAVHSIEHQSSVGLLSGKHRWWGVIIRLHHLNRARNTPQITYLRLGPYITYLRLGILSPVLMRTITIDFLRTTEYRGNAPYSTTDHTGGANQTDPKHSTPSVRVMTKI